jgi:3-oxoacyl-[acyl-carrier-protein] synthase II
MNKDRVGMILANQFGAMENYMKPNKLRLLATMNHMVPALLAIDYQITGHLSSTSMASASGGIAIGEAFRLIKHGYQDLMIAGGLDFNLNRHFFEGMELFGANCNKFNDDPTHASMPYDKKRAGPVMADGGGVLILESLDSALERGAKIYCEIGGFSMNTDAFHILRPSDNGIGLFKAM